MEMEPSHQKSQLFTVRLWHETVQPGQREWRGQAAHVQSGETRYFRDWPTLSAFFEAQLARYPGETAGE